MAHGNKQPQANPVRNEPELAVRIGKIKPGNFINLMSSTMCDLVKGKMTPRAANALCNEGGKLLKLIEMQKKHAKAPRIRRKPVAR